MKFAQFMVHKQKFMTDESSQTSMKSESSLWQLMDRGETKGLKGL